MRLAMLAVCLLVLTAGCIVKTDDVGSETETPSTPERIGEKAVTPEHPETPSAPGFDVDVSKIEDLVHEKMNKRRVANGREPLDRSEKLDAIARYKSWDMAQRDYFAHRGPDGEVYGYLRNKYSANCPNISQNLHRAQIGGSKESIQQKLTDYSKIATQAVNALMNSTGHRKNILNPAYEVQGIGVFVDENGTVYLTQEFCG